MLKFLRALSPRVEFVIVVTMAFGYFAFVSIFVALHPHAGPLHTNRSLIVLCVYELVLMAILFPFLRIRGWTFSKIGLDPTWRDTGLGILLFFAFYAVWVVVWIATVALAPETAQRMSETHIITQVIPATTIVANGMINPLFEEVFVCGYVMTALRKEGHTWFALNASVAIRLLYHLYQGPLGVLSIIPTGLMSGYWYARTGRLWPVIVAHAAMDMLAMLVAGH
jgi:membrane protease YdiL (CAAX protease family)